MNVMGGIEKALSNEKIGMLLGALAGEQTAGNARNWDWWQNIDGQLHHAWTDFHFPDLNNLRYDLMNGYMRDTFKACVLAVIMGEIGKEINIHPKITKVAKIAQHLGVNAGIGVVGVAAFDRMTLQHSPAPNEPRSVPSGSSENPLEGEWRV